VKSAIEAVRKQFRDNSPKIMVGGLAFANSGELAAHVGADGYAPDPDGAVRFGGQLVGLTTDDVAA